MHRRGRSRAEGEETALQVSKAPAVQCLYAIIADFSHDPLYRLASSPRIICNAANSHAKHQPIEPCYVHKAISSESNFHECTRGGKEHIVEVRVHLPGQQNCYDALN